MSERQEPSRRPHPSNRPAARPSAVPPGPAFRPRPPPATRWPGLLSLLWAEVRTSANQATASMSLGFLTCTLGTAIPVTSVGQDPKVMTVGCGARPTLHLGRACSPQLSSSCPLSPGRSLHRTGARGPKSPQEQWRLEGGRETGRPRRCRPASTSRRLPPLPPLLLGGT